MEILEYVKKFRLDQENFNFNREEFLQAFGKDFLEDLNICLELNPCLGTSNHYGKFKKLVNTYQRKFKAISDLKVGKPFSQGFWNAFYAIHVIPARDNLYPGLKLVNTNKPISITQDKKYTK